MKTIPAVKPPTRKEMYTLRLMIMLGVVAMFFFLNSVLSVAMKEYNVLYWLLITSFIFTCLKILHEWCHYLFITVPKTPPLEKQFTVDILTTFCAGEPYEMIIETLTAIQAITYPHTTYLCDEADDPYLRDVCKQLGVKHVTRVEKKNAKAGNINNALKHATGELCVVLDPDHVPQPNFLDPIVPHFNDPQIGYVQIVQAYSNNYEGLIAKGAAQQTYQFYGPMMMTMNKYGTVLAIGANCTFRRAALDSIGGHAAGLAEDMHTSMQLHAKGWKSIYVPEVLARGLVPSTLSAYYKQQLKWSRGVFELLVTSYPKLFTKFTWQQKLHYGVIPLHYMSGLIFLINFIIPIFSLFLDISPIHMNLPDFGLAVFPFVVAIVLIRHFVQWWVMEDKERGFHVVGGLLMIGTWWIFILGFVYTILRRKVPYVPTPKDGNEANNWPLNIPNLIVLGLSLSAIVYGLYIDWSPYSFMMAGFAGVNCLFMTFNILASRQQQFWILEERYKLLGAWMKQVKRQRINLWLFRRRIYTGVRSTALMSTILLTCVVIYFSNLKPYSYNGITQQIHKRDFFLYGVSLPEKRNDVATVKSLERFQQKNHADVVALTIPWGNKPGCFVPLKEVSSIYQHGSLPMINWKPYQTFFSQHNRIDSTGQDEKVFRHITHGDYDSYLHIFAEQIKALDRPVYIRFAQEADNPAYPWSKAGKNTPEEFKAAWQYVHRFFTQAGAANVIWVWNPWKASSINAYYPGKRYVDWLSVTGLQHNTRGRKTDRQSLEEQYKPFHNNAIVQSGFPVMLVHSGFSQASARKDSCLLAAYEAAKNKYPEIRGFMLLPNAVNTPISDVDVPRLAATYRQGSISPRYVLSEQQEEEAEQPSTPVLLMLSQKASPVRAAKNDLFQHTVGINYSKANNWDKSYRAFTKAELLTDLKEIKQLGINTIRHIGPSVFDHNILAGCQQVGLTLQYAFWVPDAINFLTDQDKLDDIRKTALASVNTLKQNKSISSWHIGNTVLQKLDFYYYKPALLYQEDACLYWLKSLAQEIKLADPTRPLTMDILVSDNTPELIERLHRAIPEIDSYGLVITSRSTGMERIKEIKAPYFFSKIDVPAYAALTAKNKGVFIANWQDEQTLDEVTFDGLKDYWGRPKATLLQLRRMHEGHRVAEPQLAIKILKPALTTFPNARLTYHMLIRKNDEWVFADSVSNRMHFEWKLVRTDILENPIDMKDLGRGSHKSVVMPDNPLAYQLYIYVVKDNCILDVIHSSLNTPLPY